MDPFFEFLKGSLNSHDNPSLVKFLPKDILHKIWTDYALETFDDYELVKKNLIHLKYTNNPIPPIITSYAIELNKIDLLKWLMLEKKVNCTLLPALKSNNIEIIDFLIDTMGIKDDIEKSLEVSNIETINYIINKNINSNFDYSLVLKNNNLDVIKKFYKKNYTSELDLLYCCKNNNLEVLEWLFDNYPTFCNGYIKNNVLDCNLSNFKFLIKQGYKICERNIIYFLNQNMSLDNFKWLKENVQDLKLTYRYFMICRNDEVRKWLFYNRGNGYSFDEAIQWACAYDDVNTIKFMLENNLEEENRLNLVEKILYNSIIYGGINVLTNIYTKENNYIIDSVLLNKCIKEAYKKGNYITKTKETIEFVQKFFIK